MSNLPDVYIEWSNGNLRRVQPTADNIFGLVLSGTAIPDKIGLNDPKEVYSPADLTSLGITASNNSLAFSEITAFYNYAPIGTKIWLSLFSDAILLADVCDKNSGPVRSLLQKANGEVRAVFVNKKLAAGYSMTKLDGLDQDVWNAVGKMQALCTEMISRNMPCIGFLPGQGFTAASASSLRDLNSMNANHVSIPLCADDAFGKCAIGALAGWLSTLKVSENIGKVLLGSFSEQGWYTDGTSADDEQMKIINSTFHTKRYIFFRQFVQKSGFYFNDDPVAASVADDYSSITWNRVMMKAHLLCYSSLVNHVLDDYTKDELTGGISPGIASDWEGDVVADIRAAMINTNEISAVRCRIDTSEETVSNDGLVADLEIIRNGQAKSIQVRASYIASFAQ